MTTATNLARFGGAFFQAALTNGILPAGEGALATTAQRLRPTRERGYASPRGALYAIRVVYEALGLELPATAPVVVGAARTHRSKIRKQTPSTPSALAGGIFLFTRNTTISFGLRAFASGIPLATIATFR